MSTPDLLLKLAFELRHAAPRFSLPELDEAVQHCIVQLEDSAHRQLPAATADSDTLRPVMGGTAMTRQVKRLLIAVALLGVGCTPAATSTYPYDLCSPGDLCAAGLTCASSTLPAGSSFNGYFCTSGCNSAADCVQVPENQTAICVNAQCYLQCPSGGVDCPYGQACFTFDSNVGPVSLCSP